MARFLRRMARNLGQEARNFGLIAGFLRAEARNTRQEAGNLGLMAGNLAIYKFVGFDSLIAFSLLSDCHTSLAMTIGAFLMRLVKFVETRIGLGIIMRDYIRTLRRLDNALKTIDQASGFFNQSR